MASKKSVTIWVDSDGYVQVPQYKSVLLVSVMKGVGSSVTAVIKSVAAGKFTGAGYMGTLANKGTLLSPYHSFASKVRARLQIEVRQLGIDIKSGKLKI